MKDLDDYVVKLIFTITQDEDGYHTGYEVQTPKTMGGDGITWGCKTIDEAIKSLRKFPTKTILFEFL